MRRFWIWFDDLATTDPSLRFLIFLNFAVILLGVVPIVGKFWLGLPIELGQVVGMSVMALLALSKVTRWPNWPKGK